MKVSTAFAALTLLALMNGVDAVVGGADDKKPYVSGLRLSETGENYCTASLIHAEWVLTSAYCLEQKPTHVSVGSRYSCEKKEGQVITVAESMRHPFYNKETLDHDVALVKLSRASSVTPVQLAMPTDSLKPDETITAFGWGSTQFDVIDNSETLRSVKLQVQDRVTF